MIEFQPWPKIPRLFRPVTVTEKIDGTNACVVVDTNPPADASEGDRVDGGIVARIDQDGAWFPVLVGAQSRRHTIIPEVDNYGFASWVFSNADYLANTLGPGRHFGEWWGKGIGRGYGLPERRLSLFNVRRWYGTEFTHPQLELVPVLYHKRDYSDALVRIGMHKLMKTGSMAAPGFDRPEGVVIFFEDANQCFKVTIEQDAKPKSLASEMLPAAA